jgi:minor histocompatibility antigen H13
MANSTPDGIPGTSFNIAGNLTLIDTISQFPAAIWEHRQLAYREFRIVGSALACIYLGSHAALRRPPSASPPKTKKNADGKVEDKEDEDDQYVQGLLPSDAIMFPILAGAVLVGLYYLIKWLEDPAILNKILGAYFSVMSLASMGKFFADGLHFLTGLVFPEVWRATDGTLYHCDGFKKCQYRLSEAGERVYDESKRTPLPGGRWSELALSERTRHTFWEIRHLLLEQWTIKFTLHGIAKERFQVGLNDISGVILAVVANMIYYTTKSVFLSNIMGYAFSYTGIIMMSPTTFTTGSAVLFGLFFYDIYMVFYTYDFAPSQF